MDITVQQIQQMITDALDQREQDNAYGVALTPYHTHNKTDSPQIDQNDITNGPSGLFSQYASKEYDNG